MSLEIGSPDAGLEEVSDRLKGMVQDQAREVFGALRTRDSQNLLRQLLTSIRELQELRDGNENKRYINTIKNRWMLLLCAMLFETENPNAVQRHLGITSRAVIHALEANHGMAYRVYHDAKRDHHPGLTIDYVLGDDYGCFHIPPTRFPRKTNVILNGTTYTITAVIGSGPLNVTVVPSGA